MKKGATVSRSLRIEIQDQRLDPPRLSISARTRSKVERSRRRKALLLCLERGDLALVEAVRSGQLHLATLADAVADRDPSALEQLRETVSPADGGPAAPMLDLSMGGMVKRVLATKEATREEGTWKHYEKVTGHLLRDFGADAQLPEIGIQQAQDWLTRPRPRGKKPDAPRKPWAPNTQAGALMVAGYLWRKAIELELDEAQRQDRAPRLTTSPWAKVETPKRRTTRHSFLEPQEWEDARRSVEGYPEEAALALMCLGGLRIMEAAHLRTGTDLDLEAGKIRVQPRGGEHAWKPKHDHSVRDVPIPPSLRVILERHVEAGYAGVRYFLHVPGADRPPSYSTLQKWVKATLEGVGLQYGREGDGLTPHSLRHTFASWLVREDVSLKKIAMLMGNTVDEVDRTYSHLVDEDLTRAMHTLEKLLESGEEK